MSKTNRSKTARTGAAVRKADFMECQFESIEVIDAMWNCERVARGHGTDAGRYAALRSISRRAAISEKPPPFSA